MHLLYLFQNGFPTQRSHFSAIHRKTSPVLRTARGLSTQTDGNNSRYHFKEELVQRTAEIASCPLPFVSGDVDADLAHRTLDVGLDDAAEVLQDQPQRVARDRHVPARSRNATSVEFYVKYGSLLIDFVFVIGAAI